MKVEVLAPGGSRDAIFAAIYSGADAVYTGTDRFSARAYAKNPGVEELCGILDFAHLHGKKIYLTVNTLLTEEELEQSLYSMIRPLYEHGLDAVIVQDPGVMDYIHEYFPQMDIHASTQMTLLTGDGANLWKPYGVTRIVPARELTIGEIRQLRGETDLELEVFVHGALCYCYSGQCLLSKVIGGRSGNRGMCAQPCRLPYVAEGKQAGYLLSPKDMCTLDHVGDLIEAGVDSFKIEGRMKKPAYAAYTAHLYRVYADAWLSGLSVDDQELARDIEKLSDIYNRGGFSGGYLFEPSKKNIIYRKTNGHYGVPVGTVTEVDQRLVTYRVENPLNAQDIVEFRDHDGNSVYEYTLKEGAQVSQLVRARYRKGSALKKGQKVYRTRNNQLLQQIDRMVEEKKLQMKVPVSGRFVAKAGEPVMLEVMRSQEVCRVRGAMAEKAKGRAVESADVEKRLKKTGESRFCFQELSIDMEKELFIPLGSLAALRREAFSLLESKCTKKQYRQAKKPADDREKIEIYEEQAFSLVKVTEFAQIQAVKNSQGVTMANTRFHFPLDEFEPKQWGMLNELAGDFQYYISLPRVFRTKNKQHFMQLWDEYGKCFDTPRCVGLVLSSVEMLASVGKLFSHPIQQIAGPELYQWNARAQKVYQGLGLCGHSYLVYGRTPVMMTEGCVNLQLGRCCGKNGEKREILIQTPKKDEFMVVNYCNYCYNVVYEKNPDWHEAEDLAQIPEIQFRSESAEEVREVMEQWNYLSSN